MQIQQIPLLECMTKGCVHHHDYEQGKAVPLKMDEILEKFFLGGGGLSFSYQNFMLQIFLYTFDHVRCKCECSPEIRKKSNKGGGRGVQ